MNATTCLGSPTRAGEDRTKFLLPLAQPLHSLLQRLRDLKYKREGRQALVPSYRGEDREPVRVLCELRLMVVVGRKSA